VLFSLKSKHRRVFAKSSSLLLLSFSKTTTTRSEKKARWFFSLAPFFSFVLVPKLFLIAGSQSRKTINHF
jgi:hypothetical protein